LKSHGYGPWLLSSLWLMGQVKTRDAFPRLPTLPDRDGRQRRRSDRDSSWLDPVGYARRFFSAMDPSG